MSGNDDKNGLIYLLAGFGLGALVGALAGLLFAPKPGEEIRHELADKLKDAKDKTEGWIADQRSKRGNAVANAIESDEVGA